MKKLSVLFIIIGAVMLFLLSACNNDPETATQKDMIKHGEFIYELDDDDSHDFKLIMEKNYRYSLYIKDFKRSYNDKIIMELYTGEWSPVFTYEYEYDTTISHVSIFSKKKSVVLGIYLLEGYVRNNYQGQEELGYFGYEKSSGKGNLFFTDKKIDEEFLKSYRESSHAVLSSNLGPVDLPGFEFESK